jgi:RNA polymerase sigma factor (sigma-70 family)
MLRQTETSSDHEELFLQRYQLLHEWALRLTHHDRERAEDLLHDAFIHFTLGRPPLDEIQSLEAYLHVMLRNLHLSQARRLARSPHSPRSLVDYDSAELGWQGTDPRNLIHARDELQTICRYACERKDSAKAASVLILRFFHGYYPEEIARIMRTTRGAVEDRLRMARNEARVYLQNPGALSFIQTGGQIGRQTGERIGRQTGEQTGRHLAGQTGGSARETAAGEIGSSDEIVTALRVAVFRSRRGECLSREGIAELYRPNQDGAGRTESRPVGCERLAHFVSCRSCLDAINETLGLPLLAERHAADTVGIDTRNRPGGGSKAGGGSASGRGDRGGQGGGQGGGTMSSFAERGRRRAREVFEHRPQELRISVNGFILGGQRIRSALSELTLNVNLGEPIGFIEVFSEQDVRIFFRNVAAPPEGTVEQRSRLQLSDGRTLEITLDFSSQWPQLHTVYYDPLLEPALAVSPESLASEVPVGAPASNPDQAVESVPARWRAGALDLFNLMRSRLAYWLTNWDRWLRPALAFALVLIVPGAVWWMSPTAPPVVSAAELLRRSVMAEETAVPPPGAILYRTLRLEERSGGKLLNLHRIEVWHNGENGISASRVYDQTNRLLAGVWNSETGRTIYRRGDRPLQQSPAEKNLSSFSAIEVTRYALQFELSARRFSALAGPGQAMTLEEQPGRYILNYSARPNETASLLVRASLTLRRSDLRPIEQVLVLRHGDQEHEYRLVETSVESRPKAAVAAEIFTPDPILTGANLTRPEPVSVEREEIVSNTPPPTPRLPATPELEIEALDLLSQAGADLGEQVSVRRTADGLLQVKALVETAQRKAELLRILSPLASHPAARISVQTIADAMTGELAPAGTPGPIIFRQVQIDKNVFPAYPDLRRHFERLGQTDEETIRNFAAQILDHSGRLSQRAWALKHLNGRFTADELRGLGQSARAKRLSIIGLHARAWLHELARLRRDLGPIFSTARPSGTEGRQVIGDDDGIERGIEQLFDLSMLIDRAVRSAFTVSTELKTSASIRESGFTEALQTAEGLAMALQNLN